jgi:hypothetical protein
MKKIGFRDQVVSRHIREGTYKTEILTLPNGCRWMYKLRIVLEVSQSFGNSHSVWVHSTLLALYQFSVPSRFFIKYQNVLYEFSCPMMSESLIHCKRQPYGKWVMPSWVHAWFVREVYAVGRDSVTNQNRICVYIKKSLNSDTLYHVILGFRCSLNEICALLGFLQRGIVVSSRTAWPLKK